MKTDRIKPPVAKGFETPKENEKTKSIPKTLKKTSHNSTSKKSKSKIKNIESPEQEYTIGNYLIKKTLGKGTFGKVKLAIFLPTKEKVAIKILDKKRLKDKDDIIRLKREFDILSKFNHPNVILISEIFESAKSYYSVMEYCEGGELFNYIVKNKYLCEEESAFFYFQLINGLEYIHSLGIVHRDLKPENLLLTSDHILKIIDFGLSNYFKPQQEELLETPCGSPCYASPEMLSGNDYDGFKIDIWATGIILYAMLCGFLPFDDKDNDKLFEKILECKLKFPHYLSFISIDLMKKILVTDPKKRIGISDIKKHPFYLKGKELFEKDFSIYLVSDDDEKSGCYEKEKNIKENNNNNNFQSGKNYEKNLKNKKYCGIQNEESIIIDDGEYNYITDKMNYYRNLSLSGSEKLNEIDISALCEKLIEKNRKKIQINKSKQKDVKKDNNININFHKLHNYKLAQYKQLMKKSKESNKNPKYFSNSKNKIYKSIQKEYFVNQPLNSTVENEIKKCYKDYNIELNSLTYDESKYATSNRNENLTVNLPDLKDTSINNNKIQKNKKFSTNLKKKNFSKLSDAVNIMNYKKIKQNRKLNSNPNKIINNLNNINKNNLKNIINTMNNNLKTISAQKNYKNNINDSSKPKIINQQTNNITNMTTKNFYSNVIINNYKGGNNVISNKNLDQIQAMIKNSFLSFEMPKLYTSSKLNSSIEDVSCVKYSNGKIVNTYIFPQKKYLKKFNIKNKKNDLKILKSQNNLKINNDCDLISHLNMPSLKKKKIVTSKNKIKNSKKSLEDSLGCFNDMVSNSGNCAKYILSSIENNNTDTSINKTDKNSKNLNEKNKTNSKKQVSGIKGNFIKILNNSKNNKFSRIIKGHINCYTGINSMKRTINSNINNNKLSNLNTDISNTLKTKSKLNFNTNYNNIKINKKISSNKMSNNNKAYHENTVKNLLFQKKELLSSNTKKAINQNITNKTININSNHATKSNSRLTNIVCYNKPANSYRQMDNRSTLNYNTNRYKKVYPFDLKKFNRNLGIPMKNNGLFRLNLKGNNLINDDLNPFIYNFQYKLSNTSDNISISNVSKTSNRINQNSPKKKMNIKSILIQKNDSNHNLYEKKMIIKTQENKHNYKINRAKIFSNGNLINNVNTLNNTVDKKSPRKINHIKINSKLNLYDNDTNNGNLLFDGKKHIKLKSMHLKKLLANQKNSGVKEYKKISFTSKNLNNNMNNFIDKFIGKNNISMIVNENNIGNVFDMAKNTGNNYDKMKYISGLNSSCSIHDNNQAMSYNTKKTNINDYFYFKK